jgi:FdhE protein
VLIPERRLSSEIISHNIKSGRPLLQFDDLELDWSRVSEVFNQVLTIFADYPQLFSAIPDGFSGLEISRLKDVVKAWFTGDSLSAVMPADQHCESLLKYIIQSTLKPFVTAYSKVLRSSLSQEDWRRGYCPVCGANPDFAFLEKELGNRWLLCSRCDMEWLFKRLECPFCGTQDQNSLSYYTDDGGVYRLYVCEKCKHYLKAIDLRLVKSEVVITLERLFTLSMDVQGYHDGYSWDSQPHVAMGRAIKK